MVIVVQCLHCHMRFETSLPPEGVDRVRRCPACGLRRLEVLAPDAGDQPRPSGEGLPGASGRSGCSHD